MTPTNQTLNLSRPTPNPPSDFAWEVDDATGGVAITRFLDKTATSCVVPAEIDGRPVVAIGYRAFADCQTLESATFLEGLRTIGVDAFIFCRALRSLAFPDGLQTIGDRAFAFDGALQLVAFPDGLRSIGAAAFKGCRALRSIAFSDGLQTIEAQAFSGCDALSFVALPDEIPTIGDGAFYGCDALSFVASPSGRATLPGGERQRLTLAELRTRTVDGAFFSADGKTLLALLEPKTEYVVPENVETIGEKAFYNCRALRAVALPDGLRTLARGTFSGCFALRSVALPAGLESIGNWAFQKCRALESVAFPDGLKSIGRKAFFGCKALRTVAFPDGLNRLDDNAFANCVALESVAFPDKLPTCLRWAFDGCDALRTVALPDSAPDEVWRRFLGKSFRLTPTEAPRLRLVDDVLFSADGKTLLSCPRDKTGDYVVPDGVVTVGDEAFAGCDALKSITFPAELRTIGKGAFYGCNALQTVAIPDSAPYGVWRRLRGKSVRLTPTKTPRLRLVDDVLFTADGKELLECPRDKTGDYVVPDGVETILSYAFYGCDALKSVTLPAGLESIGNCAFQKCRALESVALPDGLWSVGKEAFAGCKALRSVILPDGLHYLGDYAFYGCSSLESVALHGVRLWEICYGTFVDCVALKAVALPKEIRQVCGKAFKNCRSLRLVAFAWLPPHVASSAFEDCDELRFVASRTGQATVPDRDCQLLTLDELRARTVNGVLFDADGKTLLAFLDSKSEYVVPDGVEAIAPKAFFNCRALRTITFPAGLRTIGDGAFDACERSQANVDGLTFCGAPGSVAEEYARANGFRFEAR